MARKSISILLIVCMLICSINISVFAADSYTEEYRGDGFTRLTLTDTAFEAGVAREFSVNIQDDGDYAVFLNNANSTATNFTVTFTKDGTTQTLCDGAEAQNAYIYTYVRIGASTDVDSVSVPLTTGTWTMSVKSVAAITVGYIDIRSTTVLIDGSKQAIYPSDYNYHGGKIPSPNYINSDMNKTGAKAAGYEYYADLGDTLRRGIHLSGSRTAAYELNVQTAGTYKIKLAGQFYLQAAASSDKTLTTQMSVDGNESNTYSYTFTAGASGRSDTQELVYIVNLAAGVNTLVVAPASGGDLYIYTLTIESYDPDKENTYVLAQDEIINYMTDAKKLYPTAEYADYTTSIVASNTGASDYYVGIADKYDKSKPVSLTWDAIDGAESYTLYVSETEDFSNGVKTITNITDTKYDVYNLKTDTVYTWKVQGGSTTTAPAKFYTENTVRFINVEGMKNVRDLGGWNGLNQGMAYRGSAMDPYESLSSYEGKIAVTEAGKKVLREDLGIKTDLDFRSTLNESPLGSDINFVKLPISNYTAAYTSTAQYKSVLETFADFDNYPIYFHCSGGADRTGTVAFLLECLCGVDEVDITIDYELTSFAVSFGPRWRSYNNSYTFAETVAKMKEYEGATLKEKAENYALNTLGLTHAQISNIRSILSGNKVAFEKTNNLPVDRTARVPLQNLGNHTVSSVTFNGAAVDYTMNDSTLYMLLTESGTGTITFDDGNTLTFAADETSSYEAQSLGEGFTRFTMSDKDFLAGDVWKFPVTITEDGDYTVFLQKDTTEANNFAVSFENESGDVVALTEEADPSDGYKYNYVRVGSAAGESAKSVALTAGEWTMSVKAAADTTMSYIDVRRTDIPMNKEKVAIYPSDFNTYASIAADSDVNGVIGKLNLKASGYDYYADYDNADLAASYNGDRQIYVSPGKTVTYKLDVTTEGTYTINLNYAFNLAEKAAEDKAVTVSVTAGDTTETGSYTYAAGESGKSEKLSLTLEAALTAGEQTITITTADAGAYLENLTISGGAGASGTDTEVSRVIGKTSADVDKITATNVAAGSQYNSSYGMDNGKYVDVSFDVPADAKYDVILVAGSSAGMDYKVALNNITLEGRFASTTIYDTDGTTIITDGFSNYQVEHNAGTVSLKSGTYTVKVSALNSGSLRLHKIILRKSGAYESTFIEEATFDQSTRTAYNVSSDVNAQPSYMIPDSASAYAEHTITMSKGNYELSINYGCQTYEGVIGVYVNGEYYGKFDAPINSAWNTNQTTLKLTKVNLKEGENIIKFTAPGGKYYCYTTFSFKAIEEPYITLYNGMTAEPGSEVTAISEGDMTLRALLPKDVEGQIIRVFFAIYEDGVKLHKIGSAELITDGGTVVEIPVEDITFKDGSTYTYKTFFWNRDNDMTPLF